MPDLIRPSPRVHRSFLAAMTEVQAEGGSGPDDDSNTGQAIRKYASRWADPAEFARYLHELEDEARINHRGRMGVSRRPRCSGSAGTNTWAGYRSATGSPPT